MTNHIFSFTCTGVQCFSKFFIFFVTIFPALIKVTRAQKMFICFSKMAGRHASVSFDSNFKPVFILNALKIYDLLLSQCQASVFILESNMDPSVNVLYGLQVVEKVLFKSFKIYPSSRAEPP